MRLMIAYDGSSYANAVIDDLPRAGLPIDAEVMVVNVADFSIGRPYISEFNLISAASRRIDLALQQVRNQEARVLASAGRMITKVARSLLKRFPNWKLRSELLRGRPSESLLLKAEEWNADLIAGGSRGRSAIDRFFLGSVSRSVAEKASASVRIVRRGLEKESDEPTEIVMGIKQPSELARMVDAIHRRVWPDKTRIRLVAIDEGGSGILPGETVYQIALERLESAGLQVSIELETGDPKTVFLKAANARRADALFVVAGRENDLGALDDTAKALINDADCTVELVR